MARTIPSPTSGRTIPTPAATPGGGGANPWREWTDIPLDDGWTVIMGTGATTKSATVGMVGDQLHVNFPNVNANIQYIGGTVDKGINMIRSLHIQPWAECDLQVPAGAGSNYFYPEAFLLKLEVQFDDTLPITGPVGSEGSNQYGRYMQCGMGIVRYGSDQSGSPVVPPADGYDMAIVFKAGTISPDADTGTSAFLSGYSSWNNKGSAGAAKWRCQPGASANGHDAIAYQVGWQVAGTNWTGQTASQSGSYATQNPYAISTFSGWSHQSNSTKYTGDQYYHIFLSFGAYNSTASRCGQFRIRSIRYLLQPIDHRNTPTPV